MRINGQPFVSSQPVDAETVVLTDINWLDASKAWLYSLIWPPQIYNEAIVIGYNIGENRTPIAMQNGVTYAEAINISSQDDDSGFPTHERQTCLGRILRCIRRPINR